MLAIVGVLSLIPSPDIGGSDKFMHFITYFILSAIFTILVRFNRSLLWVAVGLIGYGIFLEYLQGMTGYRFLDNFDMLANSVGVMGGLLLRATPAPLWFRRAENRIAEYF